jgi:hypothetical protein
MGGAGSSVFDQPLMAGDFATPSGRCTPGMDPAADTSKCMRSVLKSAGLADGSLYTSYAATAAAIADGDLEEDTVTLADSMMKLSLIGPEKRFFGKSSGAMLVQTALDIKKEYEGAHGLGASGSSGAGTLGGEDGVGGLHQGGPTGAFKGTRKEYWGPQPVSNVCHFH